MIQIAQELEENRSCTTGLISTLITNGILPAGTPTTNPVNNAPYRITTCLAGGVEVFTQLNNPTRYNGIFTQNFYTSVSGSYLNVYYTKIFTPLGDAGYEKTQIYLQ